MTMRFPSHAGFSRAEALLILSLLLLVISVAAPLFIQWRDQHYARRAYHELRLMISAADQYNREYRLWPVPDATGRGDFRYGLNRNNGDVMRMLRGIDGPGNEGHRGNTLRIDFFTLVGVTNLPAALVGNGQGDAIDPWGRPYQMVFDANYDSICSIPESSFSDVVGEGVVMWSMGPDRRSDSADDLRSWSF